MNARVKSSCEAIQGALQALPGLSPEAIERIPAVAAAVAGSRLHAVEDLPRLRIGGGKAVRKELVNLQKAAFGLCEAIHALHKDTLAILAAERRGIRPPMKIDYDVWELTKATEIALRESADYDAPPPRDAHRKMLPGKVAQSVVRAYENLTGLRATLATKDGKAYGPLLDLTAAVFTALGIGDASAEARLREALYGGDAKSRMEKRRQKGAA